MKTIIALVDFSDVSFKILKQAHTLAKAFDSHVILLHVVPEELVAMEFGTVLAECPPETMKAHEERLRELCNSLAKFGVLTTAHPLYGATLDTVLEECRRLGADMILVGSHHHGGIHDLLVGSITSGVLSRAPCPVLVVPADDAA